MRMRLAEQDGEEDRRVRFDAVAWRRRFAGGGRIMRNPAVALLSIIAVGIALVACSSSDAPGDNFNLSVHNPTPSALARTGPTAEPGEDPYNRTVPLP
jgi:hypothetical protein